MWGRRRQLDPAMGTPKLCPSVGEGGAAPAAPALGNRLSSYSGPGSVALPAAQEKELGFTMSHSSPGRAAPAGRARAPKNPKIAYFEAPGRGGFARGCGSSLTSLQHRAALSANPNKTGAARLSFHLNHPKNKPNLSQI